MIDLRAARADPEGYRNALARKGAAETFDELLAADERWRELETQASDLRAQTKTKGKPSPEELERLTELKAQLQQVEAEHAEAARTRDELLERVPNPPDPSAPDGTTDEDAEEIKRVGEQPAFGFEPRDHLDLSAPHGWIDLERAARVSGSRFAYRVGDAALVELALYRFALDRVVAKGFVPVLPPILVREEAMYGTGFFPTEEMNIYKVERDELFLTGTSEVGLASFHLGEELDSLPRRYAGYSTNFRRESGAAGKDTRGMFRVHQFDKVEMFVFCEPERSPEEHDDCSRPRSRSSQELGIPYRVVNIAARRPRRVGDEEVRHRSVVPGQQRYREISSTSNTTDYQARRLGVRFRRDGKLEPVHTLNGTAMTARWLIALMENFQDEGGAIAVPEVLTQFGAPPRLG